MKKMKYGNWVKPPQPEELWILSCIGKAVETHKTVHGIRKGKNSLIVLDDVDIPVVIEREGQGEEVPLPLVMVHQVGRLWLPESCPR